MAKVLNYQSGRGRTSPSDEPAPQRFLIRSRAAVLGVGVIFTLLIVLIYSGQSGMVVIYRLLTDGFLLLAWLASAFGMGSLVLAAFSERTPASQSDGAAADRASPAPTKPIGALFHFTTSVALGLGLFSLVILGLGLAGALNRTTAIVLLVAGVLAIALCIARIRQRQPAQLKTSLAALKTWWGAPARWEWAWLVIVPLLAIAIVGTMVVPGILWKPDEPLGYDVVEYHLQVPREWYEAQRIVALKHNAFSYFPFGVEMHYLLAMHLAGGPWRGMYLAQLMHLAMVVLTVLAACAVATRLGGRGPSVVLAGLAAALIPWLTQLGAIAYNEGGFLLYSTLAIGWALNAILHPTGRIRRFLLGGVMAGLACGTKLTAVPEVLIGVPAVSIVVMAIIRFARKDWRSAGDEGHADALPQIARRDFLGPILFGLAGLLVFSPWLIRNQFWAGNPVFPEAAGMLGKGHFSDVQVDRWRRAHSPQPAQLPPIERLKEGWRQIATGWQFGYALLPLSLVALAITWRSPVTWFAAGMLLLLTVIWLGFTHLQGRFFLLAVPLCVLMIAQVRWRMWLPLALAVVIVAALPGWRRLHDRLATTLHGEPGGVPGMVEVLGNEDVSWLTSIAMEQVPPDAPVTLLGDAKVFWYTRPMTQLHYRTIFDADTSSGRSIRQAWTKGVPAADTRVLLIDPGELNRFDRTYQPFPPPPAEWTTRPEWVQGRQFVVIESP